MARHLSRENERAISDPRFPEFLKNPSGGKVKAVRLDPVFRSPVRRHPAPGLLSEGEVNKLLVETRPSLSCQRCDRRPIRREFPRELFRKHGISYDLAKQTKSELFRDLLPLLNSGRIVLPCRSPSRPNRRA